MQAALMSWWSGADMDLSKLPPPQDAGFVKAALNASDEAANKALASAELHVQAQGHASSGLTYLQKEQARHSAATAFTAATALRAIHELALRIDAIHKTASDHAEALNESIDVLADAVKGIQDKGLSFAGTWNRSVKYRHGDIVAHAGALWIASAQTVDMPGATGTWQKMLKSDHRGQFTAGE